MASWTQNETKLASDTQHFKKLKETPVVIIPKKEKLIADLWIGKDILHVVIPKIEKDMANYAFSKGGSTTKQELKEKFEQNKGNSMSLCSCFVLYFV